jgi:hypothetical protein
MSLSSVAEVALPRTKPPHESPLASSIAAVVCIDFAARSRE